MEGECHICGTFGKLSYEHVPPRSAFNDKPVLHTSLLKLLNKDNLDGLTGKKLQRGAGSYTLCERCNSLTGHWYGDAFADWAHQAINVITATRGQTTLIHHFHVFPVRIIKQIICMFFSVSSPKFRLAHPDLVKFVLNPDAKYFPPNVHLYAFYTMAERSRSAGVTLRADRLHDGMRFHTISEVTFPPFGFLLTIDCLWPDKSFGDISGFANFDLKDWVCGLTMRLPIMPIYTAYPGDYRSREEVLRQAAEPPDAAR
jgi:hypothetical protein